MAQLTKKQDQKVLSFDLENLPEIEYEGIRISKETVFGIKDMLEVFSVEEIKDNLMIIFSDHLEKNQYELFANVWDSFRMLYSFLDGIERDNRLYLLKKKENSKE